VEWTALEAVTVTYGPPYDLTRDGSKDAFSRKDMCHLGVEKVEINNEPHFMLPKVKFWQNLQ